MTVGVCPSITATTELVVPRSIPTTLAIKFLAFFPIVADHLQGRRTRVRRSQGGKAGRAGPPVPCFALPLTDNQGRAEQSRRRIFGCASYDTQRGRGGFARCLFTASGRPRRPNM